MRFMRTGDETGERARELFLDDRNTYGCAETTLVVLKEAFGLPDAADSSAALALNGGIAYSGSTCGAVSGAALAVGMLAGRRIPDHRAAKRVARLVTANLLGAFEAEFGTSACRELIGQDLRTEAGHRGFIESGSFATIQRLHAFGELIGNTDMHFGNLAFFLDDTLPFRVTPAYDMLPMLWAPGSQGELIERPFAPAPPLPAMTEPWREAAGWAEDFWDRVATDSRLSQEFTRIASEAGMVVRNLRRHVG